MYLIVVVFVCWYVLLWLAECSLCSSRSQGCHKFVSHASLLAFYSFCLIPLIPHRLIPLSFPQQPRPLQVWSHQLLLPFICLSYWYPVFLSFHTLPFSFIFSSSVPLLLRGLRRILCWPSHSMLLYLSISPSQTVTKENRFPFQHPSITFWIYFNKTFLCKALN